MTPERHQRVMQLFDVASDLTADEREAYLGRECGSDAVLRREVDLLLAKDGQADHAVDFADRGGAARVLLEGVTLANAARPAGAGEFATDPGQIGPYRVLRRIGQGGMGIVFEAEQENPRRVVALKVIRGGLTSPALRRRFEYEAQVLGRLHHPAIAQIFEAGAAPTPWGLLPYFAMELVAGRTLDAYIREASPELPGRLSLFAHICDGVEHAHQKGVIHRDLKPGNILVVESEGQGPGVQEGSAAASLKSGARGLTCQPKILDFGVARATDADIQAVTLQTDPGQIVGTIPYMSPEQVVGDSTQVDTRTDVYSLGVIAYEMLTGLLPYDLRGRTLVEAARIVREVEPARPSSVDRRLRGDLETILLKALEKDKRLRYQSASELAADVRRFLRDEPISAHPPSAFYHLRKFTRRNKTLVAAAAVVFCVSIAAAVTSTVMYRAAERERRAAESRFGIARDLSEMLLHDLSEKLGQMPGGQELRLRIIREAGPYYFKLADERPDDLELRRQIWLSLQQLGRLAADVGQHDESRAALLRAQRLLDEALAAPGALPAFQIDRGWNDYWLGWTSQQRGDREGAEASYRAALDRLAAHADPDSDDAAEKLATVTRRLGDLVEARGDLDGAERLFRAALAIDEARAARRPESPDRQLDLTRDYRRLGGLAQQRGDRAAARDLLSRTLTIRERLAAEHPRNTDYTNILPVGYDEWAAFLAAGGELEAAREAAEKAVALGRRIVEREPRDAMLRRNYAGQCLTLADVLEKLGDSAAARELRETSLAQRRALIDAGQASPADQAEHDRLTAMLAGEPAGP